MQTKHLKHGGETLPMQGVTCEGVVRYLRAHDPKITRERLLGYFAPEDREQAGLEYDRQAKATT